MIVAATRMETTTSLGEFLSALELSSKMAAKIFKIWEAGILTHDLLIFVNWRTNADAAADTAVATFVVDAQDLERQLVN